MNNDLISREALKKAFEKVYPLTVNDMGGVVNKRIYDIIDNAPTIETKTTKVIISDDFGNEIKGFYDKGRDMIFTGYGYVPRKWFDAKYTITEVKNNGLSL